LGSLIYQFGEATTKLNIKNLLDALSASASTPAEGFFFNSKKGCRGGIGSPQTPSYQVRGRESSVERAIAIPAIRSRLA